MGTNFADGKGNVTAFLSYRHADPVASSQRDFGACQLFPPSRRRSQRHRPRVRRFIEFELVRTGRPAQRGTSTVSRARVSCRRARWRPRRRRSFNSQPFIYMTREDDRYNAAFMAHEEIDRLLSALRRILFHGRQDPPAGRAGGAVQGQQSARSDRRRRLLRQLQQSVVERPGTRDPVYRRAQIAANAAPIPGSATRARSGIGRRNVEGGDRFIDFEHTNYRAVFGTKGDLRRCLEL